MEVRVPAPPGCASVALACHAAPHHRSKGRKHASLHRLGAMYFYRYHLPGPHLLPQVCLGLIVGGAIGNIIDRLRFGYVIDFIHVHWFPGIFNVADSSITVGVAILALFLALIGDGEQRRAAADDALLNDLLSREPHGSGSSVRSDG